MASVISPELTGPGVAATCAWRGAAASARAPGMATRCAAHPPLPLCLAPFCPPSRPPAEPTRALSSTPPKGTPRNLPHTWAPPFPGGPLACVPSLCPSFGPRPDHFSPRTYGTVLACTLQSPKAQGWVHLPGSQHSALRMGGKNSRFLQSPVHPASKRAQRFSSGSRRTGNAQVYETSCLALIWMQEMARRLISPQLPGSTENPSVKLVHMHPRTASIYQERAPPSPPAAHCEGLYASLKTRVYKTRVSQPTPQPLTSLLTGVRKSNKPLGRAANTTVLTGSHQDQCVWIR